MKEIHINYKIKIIYYSSYSQIAAELGNIAIEYVRNK